MFFLSFSRELIPQGKSGGLVIFQDRPNAFDAWGELSNLSMVRHQYIFFFLISDRC